MKIVAAKCPNCGASIKVDSDSNMTKCEYCRSTVIVEDAIEKYKVELHRSIEVSNLPKFENFIKLADKAFENKKYVEAEENYTKALELKPDDIWSIAREGICKDLNSEISDYKYLNSAIKRVVKISKENNNEELTKDTVSAITKYLEDAKYTETARYAQQMSKERLEEHRNILQGYLECCDITLELANEDSQKEGIYDCQINLIEEIIKPKKYRKADGKFINDTVDYLDKERLQKKKEEIIGKLKEIDSEYARKIIERVDKTEESNKEKPSLIKGCWIVSSVLLGILSIVLKSNFIAPILFIMVIVLVIDKLLGRIFKGNIKLQNICVGVIAIVALIMMIGTRDRSNSEYYLKGKTFKAEHITMEFNKKDVRIKETFSDSNTKYKYTYDPSSGEIEIESYKVDFKYNKKEKVIEEYNNNGDVINTLKEEKK